MKDPRSASFLLPPSSFLLPPSLHALPAALAQAGEVRKKFRLGFMDRSWHGKQNVGLSGESVL
ncbi:MAG: hypothetical protein D6795_08615 [Deltaproteobacteria bacterium]|nr:MAG: hypothetical protein D6795_08615 [Deltaproteobacteria bacterium]